MTAFVLRDRDHRRMAWANGGGTTYEVLTWPQGTDMDTFDWRLSLADIGASGPFSSLPGIDRDLVLIGGNGMDLEVDGTVTTLHRLDRIAFAGEATTSGILTSGPTRDLNVMTRRGRCTARVEVVHLDSDLELVPPLPGALLLVVVDGHVEVEAQDTLLPRDVLVLQGETCTVSTQGTAVMIHVQ